MSITQFSKHPYSFFYQMQLPPHLSGRERYDATGVLDLQHNGITARYPHETKPVTVDFSNPNLTKEDVIRAAAATYATGTPYFVATIVTSELDVCKKNAKLICAVMDLPIGKGILGIHFEGPCIDVATKGAHNEEIIRRNPPSIELAEALYKACQTDPEIASALVMVTMSPNYPTSAETIKWLVEHGVIVSLGHFEYRDKELVKRALDAGATGLTHVGNAWSKDPALYGPKNFGIHRLLNDIRTRPMIITDGFHLPNDTVEDLFYAISAVRHPDSYLQKYPAIVSDLSPLSGAPLGTKDATIFHGLSPVPEVLEKDGILYTNPLTGSCLSLAQQALTLAAMGFEIDPRAIMNCVAHEPFAIIGRNLDERGWRLDMRHVDQCINRGTTDWLKLLSDPEQAAKRVRDEHALWGREGLTIPQEWVL